ncbi:3-hydroxyacyl-CoA dehydrogenase [Caldimonas tepidiphila]|uniref:3-hydroxyacyl-CoA dehydrogenase n=1 Tax=Caldimonas tepidiphila TaxID=2315841 RepID=UPI000E5BF10E|nr:3-hydroxyacyl-CoA dehydrogenase [Caldimonas tepidiphila]
MGEAGGGPQLGLVGAGVMGMGIAQIAAQAGLEVRVHDARPGGAAQGCERLAQTLRGLQQRGKLSEAQVAEAVARVRPVESLAQLAGCDLVVEAIVEDLDTKRALFAELEPIVGPDCVLATNTSSLSVTAIAAGLARPQRVAGWHFFNPVPVMKIVEVIDGLQTDPAVGERLMALGQRMGHTSVRAKDTPGFIVNHAGRGFGTEALRILAEGVAEFHDVDRVLRDVAGFVIGPFELMDITALDVSHPVMESIYHQYYEEPRYRPQPLTRQMLAAGLVGRKVGQGFYRYEGGQRQAIPEAPAPQARPAAVWLAPDAPQALRELVAGLGVPLDAAATPGAESLCVVAPVGDDASGCTHRLGLDARRTVGVETLFDFSKRRVVMTTPATTREFRDAAHGLFAADGVPVTVIRDSAGLVAQRVVAHIVNIACDIAQQRIATPADIDRAVKLGLGYPFAPLAWGDRLGAATVLAILERMHAFSGDPRYRPSPWLKRRALLGLSLLTEEN